MEIFGCTYTEYMEQYDKRLRLYKERFEDRDESIFFNRNASIFKVMENLLIIGVLANLKD